MKNITIAVDLDSTLNNLDDVWLLDIYNKMYNDNLTRDDLVRWDTHTYVKPECGHKIYDILDQPGLFANLGLKDDCTVEGFEYLYKTFDVYIASSCATMDHAKDKLKWIEKHFPFFDTKRFIPIHHKYLLNTDFLIDDGPHNIEAFKQNGILVDAPYNREMKRTDYVRVKDWEDIVNFFQWTEKFMGFVL